MLWSLVGSAVGVGQALVLRWATDRMRPHSADIVSTRWHVAQTLRLLTLAVVLSVPMRSSALAGLAAFGGYWVAYWLMVLWISKRWDQVRWPERQPSTADQRDDTQSGRLSKGAATE